MTEPKPTLIVDSSAPPASSGMKMLWNYRELLSTLAGRDFRVRFVQTRLGYIWAIIQPLFLIAILTLVFNRVLNVDSGSTPYPLFALSGQILWTYFSFAAVQGGQSLIQAQHMIRKIWFPRAVLPLSKAGVGLVDLGIGTLLLLVLMLIYSQAWSINLILLPIAILLTIVASTGVSMWTSALGIRYRDVQHGLPYVIQFLFFLTPVAYPSGLLGKAIGEQWSWITYLNPMAGAIDIARFALFNQDIFWPHVGISAGIAIALLFSGWRYFHIVERNMADTL